MDKEFLKILCIKTTGHNRVIEKGTIVYTPILDMEEDYVNYISVYSSPNINDFMGTYVAKSFIKFQLAIYREIRIDDIIK